MHSIMPPNIVYTSPPTTRPPIGPHPTTSRRRTAFKTVKSLKLLSQSSTSTSTSTSTTGAVHFPTILNEVTSPIPIDVTADERVRTPTVPGPRSMTPPTARSRPDVVRSRPSSMYALPNSSAISFPTSDTPPSQRLEPVETRFQEQSRTRPQSQAPTDLPRPRMQPLRDEISNSPRRATLTNGETPRRPARRSFGSAGILEAEIVRSRDREAQAGIAISTPAPSRSGIQVVGRTAYGGASDGTGVLEVRIVILGDETSGKTALARRYTEHAFFPSNLTHTSSSPSIGHSAGAKSVMKGGGGGGGGGLNGGTQLYTCKARAETDDGLDVKMQIWVVKERHRSLTKLYYRGAHAALILYDISSPQSFIEVRAWLQELQGLDALIYVIGSKSDLAKEGLRKVERRYAREQVYRWLSPDSQNQEVEVTTTPTPAGPPRSAPASTLNTRMKSEHLPSLALARSRTMDTLLIPSVAPVAKEPRPRPYRFMSLMPGSTSMQFSEAATLLSSQNVSTTDSEVMARPRRADSMSATNALKRVSMLDTETLSSLASPPRLEIDESPQIPIDPWTKTSRRRSEDWSLMGRNWLDGTPKSAAVSRQSSVAYTNFEDPSIKSQTRRSVEVLSRNSSMGGYQEAPESPDTRGEEEIWGRCLRIGGQEVRIGELSAKANRGVNELFQSITYQLALRKRRIAMAEARRARESIQLTDGDGDKAHTDSSKNDGKFLGGKSNCCSV